MVLHIYNGNLKKTMFEKLIKIKTLDYVYLFILGLILIFARSFVGIYIFSFRIGEILILVSFAVSILLLIFPKYFRIYIEDKQLLNLQKLVVASFFLVSLITASSLTSSYAFKSSSYIWTISFIYFGILFMGEIKYNSLVFYSFMAAPVFVYLFATGYYPNFIMDFFNNYADKFQFLKGSDLMLAYIVINLLAINIKGVKTATFGYLLFSTAAYLPLLLFNSRGAFLSAFAFFVIQLFYSRKYIFYNKTKTLVLLLISYLFFYVSVLQIFGEFNFDRTNEATQTIVVTDKVSKIVKQKNTSEAFYGFYFEDGRLYSKDNTTNWRLDIWQDIYEDMTSKSIIFKGHGYKEIFPVMLDPEAPGRLGRDGLNENVHNFLVNIFARGGIFQLILFLIFFTKLIIYSKDLRGDLKILTLLVPVFMNSFFDATLEGVQYPIIFYSFLGYLYLTKEND